MDKSIIIKAFVYTKLKIKKPTDILVYNIFTNQNEAVFPRFCTISV